MITQHAEETLSGCTEHDECQQLHDYVTPPYADQSVSLSDHETFFYPLRAHQDLRLEIELYETQRIRLRWGSGDLIFPHYVKDGQECMQESVDPTRIMNDLVDGPAEIVQVLTWGMEDIEP